MTRPTTIIGLLGLVVVGIIVADFIAHPAGVTAAGNATNSFTKTAVQGLLGSVPR